MKAGSHCVQHVGDVMVQIYAIHKYTCQNYAPFPSPDDTQDIEENSGIAMTMKSCTKAQKHQNVNHCHKLPCEKGGWWQHSERSIHYLAL